MNDRLAFLRAIRANPDDDTTRLVFADWLDEHDDPLGEFIRVQIELEPIRDRLEDLHTRRLIFREEQIETNAGRTFGAAFDCDDHLRVDRHPRLPEASWRSRGGDICRWLRKGDFVINWGNDYWADWRGSIHSS